MRTVVKLLSAAGIALTLAQGANAFVGSVKFDPEAASAGNAKLLGGLIGLYVRDHGALPNTTSVAAFQAALSPYVKTGTVFVDPVTNAPYVPNSALSELPDYALADLSDTILFQDPVVHPDGKITSLTVDRTVLHGGVEVGDPTDLCVTRAARLDNGIAQYVQDHNGSLPPMTTAAEFETAVYPYIKTHKVFVCPSTSEPFQPNASLSSMLFTSIADPAQTVIVSDSDPHPDGIKTVLFADGRVVHGSYHRLHSLTSPERTAYCGSNLLRISLALQQYSGDYNERFPVFANYAQFRAALLPYLQDGPVFECPDSGVDYTVNTSLSGAWSPSFSSPTTTWVLKDTVPNSNGGRNTAFADGHIDIQYRSSPSHLLMLPDGSSKLTWLKSDGTTLLWTLGSSGELVRTTSYPPIDAPIVGAVQDNMGRTLLLRSRGTADTVQVIRPDGSERLSTSNGPYAGWTPIDIGIGSNMQPHVLWTRPDGVASVWNMTASSQYSTDVKFAAIGDLQAKSLAVAQDNSQRVLFGNDQGVFKILVLDGNSMLKQTLSPRPYPGWVPKAVAVDASGASCVLTANANRQARIAKYPSNGRNATTINIVTPEGFWFPVGFAIGADNNYHVLFNGEVGALIETVALDGTVLTSHTYAYP